ncbi:DUF4181 domain-containing protein [Alkalibacillus haloalkaliphilus]|uniref:DUF4181 domain-containing protein n=1 Tax=Alkalibacillus haloalkaliphilus TaxID=94136 RepID=UPI0029358491|nr:DUF4181 domain-containing protein [Alkalibacillus haloalkaliphilus]MDV2582003.1 DUF4181 domain-containing protein [Alkalibacillus haloalkaliphilus]
MTELVPLFLILLNLLAIAYIVEKVIRHNLHIPKEKKSFDERFYNFSHGFLIIVVPMIGMIVVTLFAEGFTNLLLWVIVLYTGIYVIEGIMEWVYAREKREYIVIWAVSATMFALVIVFYNTEFFGVVPDHI